MDRNQQEYIPSEERLGAAKNSKKKWSQETIMLNAFLCIICKLTQQKVFQLTGVPRQTVRNHAYQGKYNRGTLNLVKDLFQMRAKSSGLSIETWIKNRGKADYFKKTDWLPQRPQEPQRPLAPQERKEIQKCKEIQKAIWVRKGDKQKKKVEEECSNYETPKRKMRKISEISNQGEDRQDLSSHNNGGTTQKKKSGRNRLQQLKKYKENQKNARSQSDSQNLEDYQVERQLRPQLSIRQNQISEPLILQNLKTNRNIWEFSEQQLQRNQAAHSQLLPYIHKVYQQVFQAPFIPALENASQAFFPFNNPFPETQAINLLFQHVYPYATYFFLPSDNMDYQLPFSLPLLLSNRHLTDIKCPFLRHQLSKAEQI